MASGTSSTVARILLRNDSDLADAREASRRLAELLGASTDEQARFATAVSEIGGNALVHADGGIVELSVGEGLVHASVTDCGAGIGDPEALLRAPGPGLGAARNLVDTLELESIVGVGTRVDLALRLAMPVHIAPTVERLRTGVTFERRRDAAEQDAARVALQRTLAETIEQARRARAELLANTSHEIRTPLNAVLGMTRLLGETPLDPAQRELVQTIASGGDHLLAVTDRLLEMSRVEAAPIELAREPVSVVACVEETLALLAGRAAEHDLDLEYSIDSRVPSTVVGDAARINEVLTSLVRQALERTEHGGVTIALDGIPHDTDAASESVEQRWTIELRVRDTGIAITPERTASLQSSRRLAERMGGTVAIESSTAEGSVVVFTMIVTTKPEPRRSPPMFAGRILVVSPSSILRSALSSHLARLGMDPEAVATTTEAEARLRSAEWSIVFVDDRTSATPGRAAALLREVLPPEASSAIVRVRSQATPSDEELSIARPLGSRATVRIVGKALAVASGAPARRTTGRILPTNLNLRILVAEDNLINRKVAAAVLKRLGYAPDFATNGREAVDAALAKPYDVVLMDVQMPVLDGLAATRELVDKLGVQRPRIVGVTANAFDEDRQVCLDAGMDDYIAKPYTVERLVSVLERCPRLDDGAVSGQRRALNSNE